jgi:predicted metal-dependent hydrolase
MEQHTVTYEGSNITFTLIRKRVKNINLRVKPDLTVIVSANKTVSSEQINKFVEKKAPWILKNIRCFAEKNESYRALQYQEGEIIHYLGVTRQLTISPAEDKEEISLDGRFLRFLIKDGGDFASKKQLFDQWLKNQGENIFNEAVDRVLAGLDRYRIEKPLITVRTMKSRWGSCSFTKRKITLNTELLKFPLSCIDYVVLHELAHFIHHKHDRAFYNFLSQFMPDYKEWQQLLKTAGIEKI